MTDINGLIQRILFRLRGRVLSLPHQGTKKGNVLISYLPYAFFTNDLSSHTNYWECREIARLFQTRGYAVDIIHFQNTSFVPKKTYDFFLDISINMERLSPLVGEHCKKILHITHAHWKVNNEEEEVRLKRIVQTHSVQFIPDRPVKPSKAIEIEDYATCLGNEWTINTYSYAGKPITRIPISTTHEFEFIEKDWKEARKKFLWFGGAGPVHKGLDLVLEAFEKLPDHTLYICGKLEGEKEFTRVYERFLSLPNVVNKGWVRPESPEFEAIRKEVCAVISPSCAEGGGGATILCMHAGLIPVATPETSVDIGDFGILIPEGTPEAVREAVLRVSAIPVEELRERSNRTVAYVRQHHTRKAFSDAFSGFLTSIGA